MSSTFLFSARAHDHGEHCTGCVAFEKNHHQKSCGSVFPKRAVEVVGFSVPQESVDALVLPFGKRLF